MIILDNNLHRKTYNYKYYKYKMLFNVILCIYYHFKLISSVIYIILYLKKKKKKKKNSIILPPLTIPKRPFLKKLTFSPRL